LNSNNTEIKAFYDEERIIQVIHNLLSNAIKFCSKTDGKITITITEKQSCRSRIHNNGKELKEEEFQPIFDKFYQSRNQNVKKTCWAWLRACYLQTDYRTP
jgi:signal transduction histidine kinase